MARFTERRRGAGLRGDLDLNFANGYYVGPNSSGNAFPVGWSFSRTDTNGTATALDLAGNVIQFATGVPRITNRGILVEEARTNIVAISNANPTDLTNAQKAGDAAATLTLVSDTSALATAGLSTVVTGGQVFKLDNSAGSTAASLQFIGTSTSAQHALSAWVRGSGDFNFFTNGISGTTQTLSASYSRKTDVLTGAATAVGWRMSLAAGGIAYVILPQMELGAFATSPIITTGAAGTRGVDAASIVLPSNVSSFAATYNSGTTATGAVTPGATFDLVTARAWLNGYLQRFRVT
jgi:hypothetical protein